MVTVKYLVLYDTNKFKRFTGLKEVWIFLEDRNTEEHLEVIKIQKSTRIETGRFKRIDAET